MPKTRPTPRSRVRRFFYVYSKRCKTVHMMDGKVHTEGVTRCGRVVVAKRWKWLHAAFIRQLKVPRCTQCERAP